MRQPAPAPAPAPVSAHQPADQNQPTSPAASTRDSQPTSQPGSVLASVSSQLADRSQELATHPANQEPDVQLRHKAKPKTQSKADDNSWLIIVETVIDEEPDLSWLEQTDDQMGEGFEQHAQERLAAYFNGEWQMVGLVVTVLLAHMDMRESSMWGIESDSDDGHFYDAAFDLLGECLQDIPTQLPVIGGHIELLTSNDVWNVDISLLDNARY